MRTHRATRLWVMAICLFVCVLSGAQTTPNLNLNLPVPGTPNWGPAVNTNFIMIDTWSATVCPRSACTFTGPVTVPSMTVTGAINTGSLTSTGPISGTALTVAGAVSAGSVTSTGPISGTAITGTTITGSTAVTAPVLTATDHLAAGYFTQTGTPLTADLPCTVGTFWVAPILGSTNAWRMCNNGTLSSFLTANLASNVAPVCTTANGTLTNANCAIPPTQVTWPPSCTTGVYSPVTNTCVAPGTAANPAGASGETQINMGGVFSSIPGSAPLNANGVQYQGNVQGATLLGTTSVQTPSITGYRQNSSSYALGARDRDRDGVLRITVTPQDMPNCSMSGRGLIDDAPCFNAAINYLSTLDKDVQRRLMIPYSVKGYFFRTPGYLQQLPHDFGDYHGYAGYVTQGSASLYIANGVIQTCTAAGGTGYAPNASLPVYIYDPSLKGSGGYATVQTDATGTPTGCTVVQGGMNYLNTGVITAVVPIGGDGAAATASLSGGTFATTQNPITPSAGGSGYISWGTSTVPVSAPGLTCTTLPTFTATLTNTSVTAVNVVTAGAGCTYGGNPAATVPLAFGASCGGAQCTLLPPEPAVNMPCGVALIANLTIEGVGNPTINTQWDAVTANTSQMIAFCDPGGTQSYNITLKNFTVDASFFGFYFPMEVHHLITDGLNFGSRVAFPMYANSFSGTYVNPVGTLAYGVPNFPVPNLPSVISNTYDAGYSGITCGGAWVGRTSAYYPSLGVGNVGGVGGPPNGVTSGGYQMLLLGGLYNVTHSQNGWLGFGHYMNPDIAQPCSNLRVENFYNYIGITHSATSDAFDAFFEQYIWKTQNGPLTPYADATHNLSNGQASCKFTQTVVDRTVDYNFGYASLASTTYPYYQCFPGVTYSPFVFYPRYSSQLTVAVPNVSFSNIISQQYANRPVITGRFDYLRVDRLVGIGRVAFTDPYLQTGEIRGGVNVTSIGQFSSRIEDVQDSGGNLAFSLGVQFLQYGFPVTANQFIRNVRGVGDAMPLTGNLGGLAGAPNGPGPATFEVVDSYASAAGAGGAILLSSGANYTNPTVAIRSSLNSLNFLFGDLLFFTRTSGNAALTEAARLQAAGNWKLTKPDLAAGTQTITGCSLTGAVGGAAAGRFSAGVSGTCTVTITPSLTAPNGYRCSATDMTTPANPINQTATTTTTCTLSGTTVTGDSITWQAIAY